MRYKENGFIDTFFGDLLYVRSVKSEFEKDEIFVRVTHAFEEMLDIESSLIQNTYDKLREIEGIDRTSKELQECIKSGDKFQLVATETHMVFVGLASLCINESFKQNDKKGRAIEIITKLYNERYTMQYVDLKEYTNAVTLEEVSDVFGKRIANLFNHKDRIVINDLCKIVIDFHGLFTKTVEPSFKAPKETLILNILKDCSPWFGPLFLVGIIFVMSMIYYSENQTKDSDPNVYVDACRVESDSCYRLEAHYLPEACAPVEYDTRGASGGGCYRDAYIEKIYFENGGYITFEADECEIVNDKKWFCTDSDGDEWDIEISGRIK